MQLIQRCVFMTFLVFVLLLSWESTHGKEERWWRKWNPRPNVPRITAEQVRGLMLQGQPMAFVYAGYETDRIICNSIIIPYTWVPPQSDGSRIRLKIPKDWWVMVY